MQILCIGDVVGSIGCDFLSEKLPVIKKHYGVDAVIVNGENSADGNGITPASAQRILDAGADVITTGNHVFRQYSAHDLLDESRYVIRPANYPSCASGRGYATVDFGFCSIAVINLLGTVYLESLACPFETADKLVEKAKRDGIRTILVDIHAEATAEKKALAFHLDGRVSAVFGTHTHVQTADAQVLPDGTGFITDVGMTGPELSVLGVKPELSIARMKDKMPVRFVNAEGPCILEGCIFDIDTKTGKCRSAESIRIR